MGIKSAFKNRSALKTSNTSVTTAAQLTLRQSIYPLALVTSLFFLWGFSYGLLDTLNKHFQETLGITRTRSSGLQAAYFGAYPLASVGYANWMLRHWGYSESALGIDQTWEDESRDYFLRSLSSQWPQTDEMIEPVFIFGLCVYAIGALMMWPSARYRSFGGFCGATFICGSGLGSLETAANPYLAVCGPPKYSELRLNLAQAFNGIGTVVAPALASYVFFKNTEDDVSSLDTVQWVYLAVALFAFCLAFLFFASHIPEVTDADMEFQVQTTHVAGTDKSFWKQYRLFHAAFAQFCYVGGQVAIATWFINYVVDGSPGTSSSTASALLAGAQAAFTIGRFSGAAIMKFVRPRWVFFSYLGGVLIFLALATGLRGIAGITMLYFTLFFESICFPTIVALGIRGLGRHYKRGSGWIVGGVCGGAAVPALQGRVADIHDNTPMSMVVPLMFMVASMTYAVAVNFIAPYRIPADALGDSDIGAAGPEHKQEDVEGLQLDPGTGKIRNSTEVFEVEKAGAGKEGA